MIKAVILDVDGVVVGGPDGANFPYPGDRVSHALQTLAAKGITVSFLTGKSSFVLTHMVKRLGITGLHVGDGGATVYDPLQNTTVFSAHVPVAPLQAILQTPEGSAVAAYIFTADNYFVRKDHINAFTDLYARVVGRHPVEVSSYDEVYGREIIKVNLIAQTDEDRSHIEDTLAQYKSGMLHVSPWSRHPALGDAGIKVLTREGVSKYSGVQHLAAQAGFHMEEALGVGDTIHDWEFIEHCGYKGIMANATDELKDKADFNDPNTFLGGHVDEDGVLNIFNHFNLI